jgi:hypothetical protein
MISLITYLKASKKLTSALLLIALLSQTIFAINFVVDSDDDEGDAGINAICATSKAECTLRAAIEEANAQKAESHNITLAPGTYNSIALSELPAIISPDLVIDFSAGDFTLDGNGLNGNGLKINAPNVTVRGLNIEGFQQAGIVVNNDATTGEDPSNDNVTIDSNTIYDNGTNVLVSEVTGTNITGNKIGLKPDDTAQNVASTSGVLIEGKDTTIDGNTISGNVNGITINDPAQDVIITNNLIGTDSAGQEDRGNQGHGINIDANSTHDFNLLAGSGHIGIDISNNTIAHNDTNGISITGDPAATINGTFKIEGNNIGVLPDGTTAAANQGDGIAVSDNMDVNNTEIQVLTNKVSNNDGSGININSGDHANLSSNNIQYNQQHGINLQTNSADIIDNIVANNQTQGVTVNTTGNLLATDNRIRDNFGNGITVTAVGSATLNINTIEDNKDAGISILSSGSASINNNTVTGQDQGGISVISIGAVSATGNQSSNNGGSGFFTSGTDVTLTNNTFHQNGGHGLQVTATGIASIINNIVTSNTGSGGLISMAASAIVQGNRAVNNQLFGISLFGNLISGATDISNNTVGGNSLSGIKVTGISGPTTISSNRIGLDNNLQTSIPNQGSGIDFTATVTDDDSETLLLRDNYIANNNNHGIIINGEGTKTSPISILGNIIGLSQDLDTLFTVAAGNQGAGINIDNVAGQITIGTSALLDRNIIASNAGGGILLDQVANADISNNYIGTDQNGTLERGNGSALFSNNLMNMGGIMLTSILSAAPTSTINIGGDNNDNLITNNFGQGIFIGEADGLDISHNRIRNNKAGTGSYNLLRLPTSSSYIPTRINGAGIIIGNLNENSIHGASISDNVLESNDGGGLIVTTYIDNGTNPPPAAPLAKANAKQDWTGGGIFANYFGTLDDQTPANNGGYNIYINDFYEQFIASMTIGNNTTGQNTINNQQNTGITFVNIDDESFDDPQNSIAHLTDNNDFTFQLCPAVPFWEQWTNGTRTGFDQQLCPEPPPQPQASGSSGIDIAVITAQQPETPSENTETPTETDNEPTAPETPETPETDTTTPDTTTPDSPQSNPTGQTSGSQANNIMLALANFQAPPVIITEPTATAKELSASFASGTVTPELQESFDQWVNALDLTTPKTVYQGGQIYEINENTDLTISLDKNTKASAPNDVVITPSTVNDEGTALLYYLTQGLDPFTPDANQNGYSDDQDLFWHINPANDTNIEELIAQGPQVTNLRSIQGMPVAVSSPQDDNLLTFRLLGESREHEVIIYRKDGEEIAEISRETTTIEENKGEYSTQSPLDNGQYYIVINDPQTRKFNIHEFSVVAESQATFAPINITGSEQQMISGRSDTPGSLVFITWKSVILSSVVIADANGEFELPVPPRLPTGNHQAIAYTYNENYENSSSFMSNISRLLFRR